MREFYGYLYDSSQKVVGLNPSPSKGVLISVKMSFYDNLVVKFGLQIRVNFVMHLISPA